MIIIRNNSPPRFTNFSNLNAKFVALFLINIPIATVGTVSRNTFKTVSPRDSYIGESAPMKCHNPEFFSKGFFIHLHQKDSLEPGLTGALQKLSV